MEKEIIVLAGNGLFDFGFWIGAGVASGAFSAVGMYTIAAYVLDRFFPKMKLL